jgi:hypothetical protein
MAPQYSRKTRRLQFMQNPLLIAMRSTKIPMATLQLKKAMNSILEDKECLQPTEYFQKGP